jgi:serine/threonine protein kinase
MLHTESSVTTVKIIDFGFSTSSPVNDKRGTAHYLAPEILNGTQLKYSGKEVDIFAAGVLLFEILTCKKPFLKATFEDPFYRLIMQENFVEFWEKFDLDYNDTDLNSALNLVC